MSIKKQTFNQPSSSLNETVILSKHAFEMLITHHRRCSQSRQETTEEETGSKTQKTYQYQSHRSRHQDCFPNPLLLLLSLCCFKVK